jgi:hypothetical protein
MPGNSEEQLIISDTNCLIEMVVAIQAPPPVENPQ